MWKTLDMTVSVLSTGLETSALTQQAELKQAGAVGFESACL